jgi:hypothetical protein
MRRLIFPMGFCASAYLSGCGEKAGTGAQPAQLTGHKRSNSLNRSRSARSENMAGKFSSAVNRYYEHLGLSRLPHGTENIVDSIVKALNLEEANPSNSTLYELVALVIDDLTIREEKYSAMYGELVDALFSPIMERLMAVAASVMIHERCRDHSCSFGQAYTELHTLGHMFRDPPGRISEMQSQKVVELYHFLNRKLPPDQALVEAFEIRQAVLTTGMLGNAEGFDYDLVHVLGWSVPICTKPEFKVDKVIDLCVDIFQECNKAFLELQSSGDFEFARPLFFSAWEKYGMVTSLYAKEAENLYRFVDE